MRNANQNARNFAFDYSNMENYEVVTSQLSAVPSPIPSPIEYLPAMPTREERPPVVESTTTSDERVEEAKKELKSKISQIKTILSGRELLSDDTSKQLKTWEDRIGKIPGKGADAENQIRRLYLEIPEVSEVRSLANISAKVIAAANLAFYDETGTNIMLDKLGKQFDTLAASYTAFKSSTNFLTGVILNSMKKDHLFFEFSKVSGLDTNSLPGIAFAIKSYVTGRAEVRFAFQNALKSASKDEAISGLQQAISSCMARFGSTAPLDELVDLRALGASKNDTVEYLVGWINNNYGDISYGRNAFFSIGGAQLSSLSESDSETANAAWGSNPLVGEGAVTGAYAERLDEFYGKATMIDYFYLGKAVTKIIPSGLGSPVVYTALLGTTISIDQFDPYLLPTFVNVLLPEMVRNSYDSDELEQLLISLDGFFYNMRNSLGEFNVVPKEVRENMQGIMKDAAKEISDTRLNITKGNLMEEWQKPAGLTGHRDPNYYLTRPQFEGYETKWFPSQGPAKPHLLDLDPGLTGVAYDPFGLTLQMPMRARGASKLYGYLDSLLNPQYAFAEFREIPASYRLRVSSFQDVVSSLNKMQGRMLAYLSSHPYSDEVLEAFAQFTAYGRTPLPDAGTTDKFEHVGALGGGGVATPEGAAQVRGRMEKIGTTTRYEVTESASKVPAPLIGNNIHSMNMRFQGRTEQDMKNWEENQQAYTALELMKRGGANAIMTWEYQSVVPEKSTDYEKERYEVALHVLEEDGTVTRFALKYDDYVKILNYSFGERDAQKYIASAKYLTEMNDLNGAAVGFTLDDVGVLALRNHMYRYFQDKKIATQNLEVVGVQLGKSAGKLFATYKDTILMPRVFAGEQPTEETVLAKGVEAKWVKLPPTQNDWGALAKAFVSKSDIETWDGIYGTYGVRGIYESPASDKVQDAWGGSAYRRSVVPLFRMVQLSSEADQYAQRVTNYLVDAYHWEKEKANKYGWLVAAQYLRSAVDSVVGGESKDEKARNFGRLVFLGWTAAHSGQLGLEKLPGWARIDEEMKNFERELVLMPYNSEAIVTNYVERINQLAKSDLYRLALNYGYDNRVLLMNYVENYDDYYAGRGENLAFLTNSLYFGATWQIYSFMNTYAQTNSFLAYGLATIGYVDVFRAMAGPVFTKDEVVGAAGQLLVKIKLGEVPIIIGGMGMKVDMKHVEQTRLQLVLSSQLVDAAITHRTITSVYVKFDWTKGIAYLIDKTEYEDMYGQAGVTVEKQDLKNYSSAFDAAVKVGQVSVARFSEYATEAGEEVVTSTSTEQTSGTGGVVYTLGTPVGDFSIGAYGGRGVYGYLYPFGASVASDLQRVITPNWLSIDPKLYERWFGGAFVTYTTTF